MVSVKLQAHPETVAAGQAGWLVKAPGKDAGSIVVPFWDYLIGV